MCEQQLPFTGFVTIAEDTQTLNVPGTFPLTLHFLARLDPVEKVLKLVYRVTDSTNYQYTADKFPELVGVCFQVEGRAAIDMRLQRELIDMMDAWSDNVRAYFVKYPKAVA